MILQDSDNNGTYIEAVLSAESKRMIADFIEYNNIPNGVNINLLHITIMYSLTSFITKFQILPSSDEYATPTKFIKFPNSNCLVVGIHSDYINNRFNDAKHAGATYTYKNYIPHITISKDIGQFNIKSLNIDEFPIIHIIGEHYEKLVFNSG